MCAIRIKLIPVSKTVTIGIIASRIKAIVKFLKIRDKIRVIISGRVGDPHDFDPIW